MLGKYRFLKSAVDLCRAVDILQNKRFFAPSIEDLNDPMEGLGVNYPINGYAGIGIMKNAECLPPPVRDAIDNYSAICLTEDCANAQMWVHYADGFKGMCICVRETGVFRDAEKVSYYDAVEDASFDEFIESNEELEKRVHRALCFKQTGWSYEREWRIIRKHEEGAYLEFEQDELAAVIIGHRADAMVADFMNAVCERAGIPLYKTLIREMSSSVEIVPYEFYRSYAGDHLDKQLDEYYENCDVKRFSQL